MEDVNSKKPPKALVIQLFLFMMLVVINLLAFPNYFQAYIKNGSGLGTASFTLVYGLVDLLASVYAFMSIYRTMQRKPYSIVMLKFSSFYILFLAFSRFWEFLNGGSYSMAMAMTTILFPVLIFCVSFCIYIYKSKALKSYIPLQERYFGAPGWIAISILLMFLGLWGYSMGNVLIKAYRSRPYETSQVMLLQGEKTDGLIAFKPLNGWVLEPDAEEDFIYSSKTDSCMAIAIVTVCEEQCEYRTDYYNLLCQSFRAQTPTAVPMKEVEFEEFEINGNKFYLNSYEIAVRQDTIYWTFSALLDKDSYKVATMSNFETGSYKKSVLMAHDFMKGVRFDLKK